MCLLILVLSFAPCADADAFDISSGQAHLSSASPKESKHVLDACSPFCVCNCCNTTVILKNAAPFPISPLQSVLVYIDLIPALTNIPLICIWQPPKLG